MVEWDFNIPIAGNYSLEVEFAAQDVRSVQIDIDSKLFLAQGLAEATGGWFVDKQNSSSKEMMYIYPLGHTLFVSREQTSFRIYAHLRFTPV